MNEQNLTFEEKEEVIDLRELFFKILSHWEWFAIAVPLCVVIAFLVCLVWTPVYKVDTKIMISDSKKGELGQNVMIKELGFIQGGDMFVENEMLELQSRNLMYEVVKELELNVRYIEESFPRDRELYTKTPVRLLIDHPENIQDTVIFVSTDAKGRIEVVNEKKELIYRGNYSGIIPMGDYLISVEKNDSVFQKQNIRIQITSYENTTDDWVQKLHVSALGKNTNALQISIEDAVPERGVHLLNTLIRCYNDRGMNDRQLISTKTVEFINERLNIINRDLGTIENDAERFKKEHRLTDITADAELVMERKKKAGAELLKLQTELAVVQSIYNFLNQDPVEEFRLLPENLGLTDAALNSGISQYNEMVLRRSKLLMTANEGNPLVINVSNQLRDLKENIGIAIYNVEKNQQIKIQSLMQENRSVDKMLSSVPTQEKQYRAIARQQELKENLFLFLMQKREETEIAKLMYVPAAKIIENARGSKYPVSPRKKLVLLAGLIMGFVIPIGLVLLYEALDVKVRKPEEVERIVKSPVLGGLPELPEGKTDIFEKNFIMSESMQMIREKLSYMIRQDSCPVIMVSSTIASEGKSLVSAHLAQAYAQAGKKVIVIGCDLRNPQLSLYFKRDNLRGLSAYLAGLTMDPEELIVKISEYLHVLLGGVVPPNPTQLLSGPEMEKLLEYLKIRYDCIILDTPPLGIVADGFSISKYTDACVYIVRANVLYKDALRKIVRLEQEKRLRNMAIVVNGIKVESRTYGYGYGYGNYKV